MCGIVGFISTKEGKENSGAKTHFMKHALALDTLRGRDSTGVFSLKGSKQITIRHSLKPGVDFIGTPAFSKIDFSGWAAVGHNRAATLGKVSIKNAHPFTFGDVTLVHNGTLLDEGYSLPTYDDNLEVDSMQIAYALSSVAVDEAKHILSQIDGAFALVWYDARDKSLNVARNGQRPLHFTYNSDRTLMWFMSDKLHLEAINKGFYRSPIAGTAVYSSNIHEFMKFKRGSLVPTVQKFKGYVPPKPKRQTGTDRMRIAAARWKENMKSSNVSGTEVREEINGKKRRVPVACKEIVKDGFGLKLDDKLEFCPLHDFETHYKKHMVMGVVNIEAWGDVEWPAVIYNVPQVQLRAYKDKTWLVSPVGMGLPPEDKTYDYSMHCTLIHTDYEKYAAQQRVDESDDEELEELHSEVVIEGPQGVMMPAGQVLKLQKDGCVSCAMDIPDDEIVLAEMVNENQNLMCRACVIDWDQVNVDPASAAKYVKH